MEQEIFFLFFQHPKNYFSSIHSSVLTQIRLEKLDASHSHRSKGLGITSRSSHMYLSFQSLSRQADFEAEMHLADLKI